MTSRVSIDRRVRAECKRLLREARAVAKKHSAKLPRRAAEDLVTKTKALEVAYANGDHEAMREHMGPLDQLIDEYAERKSTMREYAESIGIAILIALFLRAFVVEAFKIPSGSMIPTMEIGDHIFVNKFLYGVRIPYTRTKFFEYRKPRRGEVIVFINPCQPEKDFIKRIVAIGDDTVEVRCGVVYINGKAVPQELTAEGGECRYWDYDEHDDGWWQRDCSEYVETLDDTRFETYYPASRGRDQRDFKALNNPRSRAYGSLQDRDFPDRFSEQLPRCRGDTKSTVSEGPADDMGKIETSAPENETYKQLGKCAPSKRYRIPSGHVFVMGDNRYNSSDSRTWGVVPLENIKGKALFIWWSSKPDRAGGISLDRIGKVVY